MAASGLHQEPKNAISSLLARIETVLVAISATAMAAIMIIVVLDATLRYVFAMPLTWSYDLIGLYLVGAVFFFALPDTMHNHGHIALDVFVPLFPPRFLYAAQALGFGVSALLTGAICWLEFWEAEEALVADERIASVVPLPTWVAHAVLTLAMAVLTLRCLYRAVFHVASAVTGRDLVELPPPPVTSMSSSEHGE